jgi:L-seryl-tRNA(Ser) seleniumtransferase
VAEEVAQQAHVRWRLSPRPVINATGVIIHTNLGRAPLSPEAVEAVRQAAMGYTDLEMSLEEGQRSSRQEHVGHLLCQLTGAEASLVVNNNASAVLLALAALASGREVIVSRGEAVEIGGGFRIPDVLRQSGAHLVEVGTTNRTNAADYEAAITENTAALLRVHPSNFRITGFTHAPTTEELVALGSRYQVPVLYDLGSGCLLDTTQFGLAYEPTPQDSIRAGVAAAAFSGDKLLGGPQAGIVVGKREYVERLARHPLARAVRIDKLSLAALSATLLHYLKGEALERVPVWRMVATPLDALKARAHQWAGQMGPRAEVVQGASTVGGGSLPGETLDTWLVVLSAQGISGGAQALAARLRAQEPAIVTRIEAERVVIDPRTVLPEEGEVLVQGIIQALAQE